MKCNFDVAIFQEQGKIGYGIVVQGDQGEFLCAMNVVLYYDLKPCLVETLACKEILSWLKLMGYQRIVLQTNCLILQHAINSCTMDFSNKGLVMNDCVTFLSDFESISFVFVMRSPNIVAHSWELWVSKLVRENGIPLLPFFS